MRYDLPRVRVAPTIASLSPESMPQGGTAFTLTVNGAGFYGNSVVNWNGSPRATQYLSDRRLVAQIAAADIAGAGPHAVTVTNPAPGGGTSLLANFTPYARAVLDNAADRVLGQPNFTQAANNNPQVGEEQVGRSNAANISTGGLRHDGDRPPYRAASSWRTTTSSRVMSWPSVSAFHNAQPADVILGQPDEFTTTCNTGGVSATSLCGPYGVAVAPSGRALRRGRAATTASCATRRPSRPAWRPRRCSGRAGPSRRTRPTMAGSAPTASTVPMGVAASDTALFVYDSGNRRILVYNDPGADFTADVAIGQASLTTVDPVIVSSTRLGGGDDGGLALDAEGRLFVASGVGQSRPALLAALRHRHGRGPRDRAGRLHVVRGRHDGDRACTIPIGLAVDPGGNLLVADFLNSRVLRYEAPLSSGMAATGILGQADFTSNAMGTSATTFSRPLGLAFDRVGNLLVSDWGNARVLAFDRPFAFILDPVKDLDGDGIPNGVEVTESRDPYVMDNDVFANARLFAMQQYRDFLNREGDEPGIVGWTNLIGGGVHAPAGDRRVPAVAGVRRLRLAGGAALLRDLPARAGLRRAHASTRGWCETAR